MIQKVKEEVSVIIYNVCIKCLVSSDITVELYNTNRGMLRRSRCALIFL